MTTTTNCPNCGAELIEGVTNSWTCGSWLHAESGAGRKTDLCRERAARQKAEEELRKVQGDLAETRKELAEAVRCLDAACVVQTNATDRRQWVTYSGWLAPGDSLCEVTMPPENTEAKGES